VKRVREKWMICAVVCFHEFDGTIEFEFVAKCRTCVRLAVQPNPVKLVTDLPGALPAICQLEIRLQTAKSRLRNVAPAGLASMILSNAGIVRREFVQRIEPESETDRTMIDLALQIKYKKMHKATATTCCILWLAACWTAFALFYSIVAAMPWFVVLFAWIASGLLFVYVPFAIVSSYREGGVLIVNSEGVVFPRSFLGFGPHPSLKWKQLKSIDCTAHKQPVLALKRNGSLPVSIQTKSMSTNDLDQLLHALELWGPKVSWSDRAADFRDSVQSGASGAESGFTKLWDEELRRRYSVTTFAPHEPGFKLRSGAYTVLKQLAFGGFSAVYLAESEHRERVVIKQLVTNSSPEMQQKALAMFQREAQILSRLRHDGIARVIDYFVEQGVNYLILEHVDGENLRELVHRRGSLSENEASKLALQMVSMLAYLHGLEPPLVHRDFTPDNLILKANGDLTLVDFGTTTEYIRSATGTLVGKQSYMPLEQIRGKSEPRTDLYALGGTLHFLVTGRDPEPLSACSGSGGELGSVIQRLMQAEPEHRFANAREVETCLCQHSCS
jgi:tRNA A-37 threonylcarbamoyl transferase component Bud32